VPRIPNLKIMAILLGAALLLWIPFEDSSTRWVRLFSMLICCLGAIYACQKIAPEKQRRWYTYPSVGLLAGVLVTPTTILLMAFKSGLHGHGSPDFTPTQVSSVLSSWPVWTAAGLLAGLAVVIWQKAH
jgi:dolichyl-phosphate-mannose--protein O-mannosyl transferase